MPDETPISVPECHAWYPPGLYHPKFAVIYELVVGQTNTSEKNLSFGPTAAWAFLIYSWRFASAASCSSNNILEAASNLVFELFKLFTFVCFWLLTVCNSFADFS